MLKILETYLTKPQLYQKTPTKFWNDDHISKGMLETHLDPNIDLASRKHEFIDQSVEWIVSIIPQGSQLLDIGCGPGLYTKRFSDKGLNVTGLDFSERSINYAREHDHKSQYVLMDYLQMDYQEKFDIITLIWCDYGALIPSDRNALLQRVYRALKPGGVFLLDVFTPFHNKDFHENTSWELNEEGDFWSPKSHLCLSAEYHYTETITCNTYVIIEENEVRYYNIWNTCFTPEFLLEEIHPIGLSSIGFYADVAGKSLLEDSDTLCGIFKK
jgi:ubiquinone/menaquinone biosynthesis C-methylase UbiE